VALDGRGAVDLGQVKEDDLPGVVGGRCPTAEHRGGDVRTALQRHQDVVVAPHRLVEKAGAALVYQRPPGREHAHDERRGEMTTLLKKAGCLDGGINSPGSAMV
jgi:hypothetical protein